jgi:hypothetical protein
MPRSSLPWTYKAMGIVKTPVPHNKETTSEFTALHTLTYDFAMLIAVESGRLFVTLYACYGFCYLCRSARSGIHLKPFHLLNNVDCGRTVDVVLSQRIRRVACPSTT